MGEEAEEALRGLEAEARRAGRAGCPQVVRVLLSDRVERFAEEAGPLGSGQRRRLSALREACRPWRERAWAEAWAPRVFAGADGAFRDAWERDPGAVLAAVRAGVRAVGRGEDPASALREAPERVLRLIAEGRSPGPFC